MKNRLSQFVLFTTFLLILSACGTAEPLPTPTPLPPTETPLPPTETPTPIPPTETPLPSPTPEGFPGWKKFEASGIELWLPESYEGGDLSKDLDVILEKAKGLGPEFQSIAQLISQNPNLFLLLAMDTKIGSSGLATNMSVTHEQVFSTVTIQMYIDAARAQLPSMMKIIDTEIFTVNDYPAARVELIYDIEGFPVQHQLMYIFQKDTNIWVVTFSTGDEEFEARLPDFEQSISTFKIQE